MQNTIKNTIQTMIKSGAYPALLAFSTLLLCAPPNLQAAELFHNTQADVLNFLEDYQPEVVSPDRELTLNELSGELQDKQVVFVGEKHDRYDHHLNQLAILRALHQQNPALAIGVEWFQQPFQAVLDDYLAGKIDEKSLLIQSGYYQRWRYDYRLLRPIMEYAKTHQLPVIALNAAQELTAKVSAKGLDGLSATERSQLPETIHPPQDDYRAYLEAVFKQHAREDADPENFITVQRIWDETMAMNVVSYLKQHPEQRMVVFAGSGHLGPAAIPGDVARSIPDNKLATLHSSERENITPGDFDYFIVSPELSLPATGKLGVWLDDQSGQLNVLGLTEDGAAAKAGVLKGDRIVSVNGQTTNSMAELLILLSTKKPGDKVGLLTERGDKPLRYTIPLQ